VKYAGAKRSIRAYVAVCLQIHCNPCSACLQWHALADLDCKLKVSQIGPRHRRNWESRHT